jgi:hypothetical protein
VRHRTGGYPDDPPVTTDAPFYRNPRDRQTLRGSATATVRVISPSWPMYDVGTHTLSPVGPYTLIDSKRRRIILPALRPELAAKPSRRDTSTGRLGQD